MAKIDIDKERCKSCLLCVSFCPRNLIKAGKKLNKKGVQSVVFSPHRGNTGKCIGCSMCAIICPDCCIRVYK